MDYKGIIFDADGTLIESLHVWNKLLIDFLATKSIVVDDSINEEIKTFSIKDALKYINNKFNLNESIESLIININHLLLDAYKNDILIKDGVLEYLQYNKENNIKMCIATACTSQLINECLKSNNIFDYFDFVVSCNDLSIDKNTSEIYDYCLDKLNLNKSEVLVFEDSIHCLDTLINANYRTIQVSNDINNKHCDMITMNFKELIK